MKKVAFLYVTLLLGTSLVYSQRSQARTAQEILDKMVTVYATCTSYMDHGKVNTYLSASGPNTKPFTTVFVRPSRFRFEFRDEGLDSQGIRYPVGIRYVVWRDESAIKSWWTLQPETRSFEMLSEAIAGATGVSGGSAINVPSMLMGDLLDSHRIQTLTQLDLTGEEKLGERIAYRIEGRDWRNYPVTIWIDKENFLLLKIHDKRKLKGSEVESITTYQPQINLNIPPDKLDFNH